MSIALYASSCTTTKQATQTAERKADFYQKIETEIQPVPVSRAEIKVNLSELVNLPRGAVFTNRTGQATATARIINDTIIITALCDSLQREVIRLETRLNETENSTAETVSETPKNKPFKIFFYGLVTGFLLFPLSKLLIKNLLKKWL